MDLSCWKRSWCNDGSKADRSRQFHAVVRQAAIVVGFSNRKTAEKVCELKLFWFALINWRTSVQFWVVYLKKGMDQLEKREKKYALKSKPVA